MSVLIVPWMLGCFSQESVVNFVSNFLFRKENSVEKLLIQTN